MENITFLDGQGILGKCGAFELVSRGEVALGLNSVTLVFFFKRDIGVMLRFWYSEIST